MLWGHSTGDSRADRKLHSLIHTRSTLEVSEPDFLNEALLFLQPPWLQVVLQDWGGGDQKVWLLWLSFTRSCWLLKMKWQRTAGHSDHLLTTIHCASRSSEAGLIAEALTLTLYSMAGLSPQGGVCPSLYTNDS